MNTRRPFLLSLLAGMAGLLLAGSAAAQSWPSKPIRVIVPYPPGGATDITARVYGKYLQDALGQTVVIENKAGAGGELGAEFVAKAPADGYIFLFGAIGSLAIHAVIPTQRPGYELSKAFVGVSMGSSVPLALAIKSGLPADSLKGLLELAKAKPNSLNYGSAGNGSTQHLTTEYFKQRTGIGMLHVPYRGSAPAITDLLGGQIDLVIETLPALSPHITNPRIRVLAVTTAKRTALLPQVPTLDELGVKGFDVSTLYGVLAPTGTPKAVIDRLSAEMQKIARMPEVQATLAQQGADAVASTPQETDALIKGEVEKWAKVAAAAKIE